MPPYEERSYRKNVSAKGLTSFRAVVKETDLWVSSDRDLQKETTALIFECRDQLETYIRQHPEFATSLLPYADDPYAPPLVREMIEVTTGLGIGPMASVAGAIAQYVSIGLLKFVDQVIVENGGDIYVKANRPVTVSLLAGRSPLSSRIGLLIQEKQMPLGVCSSSATVGHSFSMGVADLACVLSPSAALADGAATALGNRVRARTDLQRAADWARQITGILGGVVIVGDYMVTWGEIQLVDL